MRTTVTLDPDVERLIKDAMRERSMSFKEALNQAARDGLRVKISKTAKKFVQKTYPLGEAKGFRWEKALAISDAIEDEELARKLSLRK
jgi:hypothetical protein